MTVPSITYSSYFGPINKVRWYQVTDYFNQYDIDLYIQTFQTQGSVVSILNRQSTLGTEWSENIPANVNQYVLPRRVQILHVPTLKAREYVVINQKS